MPYSLDKPRSEMDVQRAVAQTLQKLGWVVVRVNGGRVQRNSGGTYYSNYYIYNTKKTAGFTDLVAFKDGVTVFVEVKKSAKGKMSVEQEEFRRLVTNERFVHICTHSPTDLLTKLQAEGLHDQVKW